MKTINDQGRTCHTCKEFKTWDNYNKGGDRLPYGRMHRCKSCSSEYQQTRADKNSAYNRQYHIDNPNAQKEYYEANKQAINKQVGKRHIQRRQEDELFKLACNLRAYSGRAFKYIKEGKTKSTFAMLGCTLEELKQHIEAQWEEGMNWDNHSLKGWHVDHIVPLASANSKEEMEKLLHYTNLQPMWGIDNIRKGNRV